MLRPQVVTLSVARRHLSRIEFEALTDWEVIPPVRVDEQRRAPQAAVRSLHTLVRGRGRADAGARTEDPSPRQQGALLVSTHGGSSRAARIVVAIQRLRQDDGRRIARHGRFGAYLLTDALRRGEF